MTYIRQLGPQLLPQPSGEIGTVDDVGIPVVAGAILLGSRPGSDSLRSGRAQKVFSLHLASVLPVVKPASSPISPIQYYSEPESPHPKKSDVKSTFSRSLGFALLA